MKTIPVLRSSKKLIVLHNLIIILSKKVRNSIEFNGLAIKVANLETIYRSLNIFLNESRVNSLKVKRKFVFYCSRIFLGKQKV